MTCPYRYEVSSQQYYTRYAKREQDAALFALPHGIDRAVKV